MIRESEVIDWEITVDRKTGFDSMRTERKRYYVLPAWLAWSIALVLSVSCWVGVFTLGGWLVEALK